MFVRDFTVYSILSDMMMGVPAVYACFAGYDEVAHHSGLERHDTLEVLRKIDQQFGRIVRARQYAARPYEIVVLSDHGQTQGATFIQRNGYGLDELVERNLQGATVEDLGAGDENDSAVSKAVREATGREQKDEDKHQVGDRKVVVMGSGNLGLIYLMDEPRRLTLEEIDDRHPDLLPALRAHPHVGWLLVRSAEHGAVALGARGANYLSRGPRGGRGPAGAVLAHGRGSPAAHRRFRLRRRRHGEQLLRRAARRGLRVRGADQLPRRHGRPADTAVRPASGRAGGAGRTHHRRRGRLHGCWPAGAAGCRATRRRPAETSAPGSAGEPAPT